MPNFKVKLFREVVSIDEVVRVIDAVNQEAAQLHALELASDYNTSCPDDAAETDVIDCKHWQVDEDMAETDDAADIVVAPEAEVAA